jgi:isoleucyl-tRNA synthetase
MEIPDSTLTALIVVIPMLLGFVYFYVTRKDKKTSDTRTEIRSADEEERDKQELARKVKKELADEADKVESIRKAVAESTKAENQAYTNTKVGEAITTMKHEFELYKVTIESKLALQGQATESKFKELDTTMENLLGKMIEIAKVGADAMVKITETVETLRDLLNELSGRVTRQDRSINNKVDK